MTLQDAEDKLATAVFTDIFCLSLMVFYWHQIAVLSVVYLAIHRGELHCRSNFVLSLWKKNNFPLPKGNFMLQFSGLFPRCRKKKEAEELKAREYRKRERNRPKVSWVGRLVSLAPPVGNATAVAMVAVFVGIVAVMYKNGGGSKMLQLTW